MKSTYSGSTYESWKITLVSVNFTDKRLAGSSYFAPIAQWREQRFSKPKAPGSSPGGRIGGVEKRSSRQAHNLKIVGSNPTSIKFLYLLC